MAMASASSERIDLLPGGESSPSSSTDSLSSAACTPDRNEVPSSSPNSNRDSDSQSLAALRSEEYRQLFRLPPDEALVQDFNCAFQESILLQGHMYLFVHYICFYSNIFGFETKKIIHFSEITSVKRAKTAGFFPNAIEIIAGGKKYFFASFLSRDEAFKLINDGWLQQGNDAKTIEDQQESLSALSSSCSQENGLIVIERVESFKQVNSLDPNDRISDSPSDDPLNPANNENGSSSVTNTRQEDNAGQDVEPTRNIPSSSSTRSCPLDEEDSDPPEIPGSYTKVAESKFPIKTAEFFNLFFSDNAVDFVESFHKGCGDKEFGCSSWSPHDKFGHIRKAFFQHPIKIYFGAKCGSCQEFQKYRVYRNSHLVIETSQEIKDVPYGDHFSVEALWDVVKDSEESSEGCSLKIYVNVAFSKRTVFRGKIVQSTLEECREAYALWVKMAHELLRQKNLEKQQDEGQVASITQNGVHSQVDMKTVEVSERQISASVDISHQHGDPVQENLVKSSTIVSVVGECIRKLCLTVKNQSQVSLILAVAFLVIFLMQMSILVLLSRPQTVYLASPGEYYMPGMGGGSGDRSAEIASWLEKRMHHLKDEMLMVEARLERLQQEHLWLKTQLKDLEKPGKRK